MADPNRKLKGIQKGEEFKKPLKCVKDGKIKELEEAVGDQLSAVSMHVYEDEKRNMLLHVAAETKKNEYREVVKYLVKAYPKAITHKNNASETPIDIAIKAGNSDALVEMASFYKDPKSGESLVHRVILSKDCPNWKECLNALFTADEKLMESYYKECSLLSTLIRKHDDTMAIKVAKEFPLRMKVKDKFDDTPIPIHHALKSSKEKVKVNVIKAFFKLNPIYNLETNKFGQNILHLAAKENGYFVDGLSEDFNTLPKIYDLLRKKDTTGRTPIEWAAMSGDRVKEKTNDKFLKFAANVDEPEK